MSPIRHAAAIAPLLILAAASSSGAPTRWNAAAAPAPVAFNDNRVAAGVVRAGVLDVHLEVDTGEWHPYSKDSAGVRILAFREAGHPLETPGPMLRVIAGERIHAWVTNRAATTLVLHGLSSRRRTVMDTLVVPSGATRDVEFTADAEGTYYYWGSTTGTDFEKRLYQDAQLNGALIVDPTDARRRAPDRVFVIQWYIPGHDSSGAPDRSNGVFTFNGRPWPNTERLSYQQGDSIRWRIINASADVHPLHLHGFFYQIRARGDVQQDSVYWPEQRRMAVTELLLDGTTMDLAWFADRPGSWLFHCHLNWHVVPNPAVGAAMQSDSLRDHELLVGPVMHDMMDHARTGMGGLVLAINIHPRKGWHDYAGPRRQLHLYIESDSASADTLRRFGYVLTEGNAPEPHGAAIQWPGPTIVLHRNEPTSITVVNRSPEPSQVHWHGLEIDSYYDGVAGVSSDAGKMEPMIMPNDSFVVHITPPRTGSFMYHTHINDIRQQSHGLYGALVVLDSGQRWDPDANRIYILSTNAQDEPIMDGGDMPPVATFQAGRTYRLRLMNITLDSPGLEFRLVRDGAPAEWTHVAKDGFSLPAWQRESSRSLQRVSIGETYDMQVEFPKPAELTLEVRRPDEKLIARQAIRVVAAVATSQARPHE
jgi:manganese oxidase